MQCPLNFNCGYGSCVVFSPIATTDGWSRKPQPLLKRHAWALQAAYMKLVKVILIFHTRQVQRISIATMVHVSSASAQLLQLTVGHVNHSTTKTTLMGYKIDQYLTCQRHYYFISLFTPNNFFCRVKWKTDLLYFIDDPSGLPCNFSQRSLLEPVWTHGIYTVYWIM